EPPLGEGVFELHAQRVLEETQLLALGDQLLLGGDEPRSRRAHQERHREPGAGREGRAPDGGVARAALARELKPVVELRTALGPREVSVHLEDAERGPRRAEYRVTLEHALALGAPGLDGGG